MNTNETVTIVIKHRFDQSPERVFDAWVDPKIARKWLFTAEGGEIIQADVDLRVGGKFTFVDRRESGEFKGDIRHVGEYLEIDRPRRLVFTFGVPQFDPTMTRVELDFGARDSGCELTLTHHDVGPEWTERTQHGWTMLLGNLAKAIG